MATQFIHGAEILRAIRAGQASQGAKAFAVSYWGSRAIDRLSLNKPLKDGSLRDLRIICDPWGGFCDPESLGSLLEGGVQVSTIPQFHAKTYLYGDRVIVGSANASRLGLGDPEGEVDPPRIEAAMLSYEAGIMADAAAWFEAAWKGARPLDRTMLPAIADLRDRAGLKRSEGPPSLLGSIAYEQGILKDMDVWVTVYEDWDTPSLREVWDATKSEHYSASEVERYDVNNPPCYIDTLDNFDTYKKGRIFIDYARNARGRPKYGGVWQVKGVPPIPMPGAEQSLYLLDELPNLVGRKDKKAEMEAFGQAIREVFTGQTQSLPITDERIVRIARSVLERFAAEE